MIKCSINWAQRGGGWGGETESGVGGYRGEGKGGGNGGGGYNQFCQFIPGKSAYWTGKSPILLLTLSKEKGKDLIKG